MLDHDGALEIARVDVVDEAVAGGEREHFQSTQLTECIVKALLFVGSVPAAFRYPAVRLGQLKRLCRRRQVNRPVGELPAREPVVRDVGIHRVEQLRPSPDVGVCVQLHDRPARVLLHHVYDMGCGVPAVCHPSADRVDPDNVMLKTEPRERSNKPRRLSLVERAPGEECCVDRRHGLIVHQLGNSSSSVSPNCSPREAMNASTTSIVG